jgi:hypothetical protein
MAHQPQYVGPEWKVNPLQPIAAGKTGAPEVLSAATGVVSLDTENTTISWTSGSNQALTLAAGDPFQRKTIHMAVKGGAGNSVVTGLFASAGVSQTTLTFNAVGDFVTLMFLNGRWQVLVNQSVVAA